MIGTKVGVIDRLLLGTYFGMEIGFSECPNDGIKMTRLMFCCYSLDLDI